MVQVADVMQFLHSLAPIDRAAAWDNVGLLLGSRSSQVRRVMTCLTLSPDVADEAISDGVNLIITHHPILFHAVKRLTDATPEGRMILALAQAGIAVYSAHTAYDDCPGGINDQLATVLKLRNVTALRPTNAPDSCKLVVFVPDADLNRVTTAIFNAGAGVIGNYEQCSFRLAGAGTFFGTDATNPAIGEKGKREEVQEWRLECVCPKNLVADAIRAMRTAHSYEEPAFDIYPLLTSVSTSGSGRVGDIEPQSLEQIASLTKLLLNDAPVQFVGSGAKAIKRVAIACGSGASFLEDAASAKADVLVTGEARFHDCLAAISKGIGLILTGHYHSERHGMEQLAIQLGNQWSNVHATSSRVESNPVQIASQIR
jgi:dinuclear metal center YbgI/SA1388 family protein